MPSSKGNLEEDKGDDDADVALQGQEPLWAVQTPFKSDRNA